MPNDSTAAKDKAPTSKPEPPDWNTRYMLGDTPWDQRTPSRPLDRVLREWQIQPCRILEMGCGTGSNAIHLARLKFDVTAFDLAPRAIEQALQRAGQAGANIDFRTADFRGLTNLGPPFAFVFDCGFYHCVRREVLGDLLTFLERVTQPGSLWLTLTGNANDPQPREKGPPRVRASELCAELEPLFSLVELRETSFEAAAPENGWQPLAWSALLRRR